MLRTLMPKAPINKHCHLLSGNDNIHLHSTSLKLHIPILPKPQTSPMQHAPKRYLRLSIRPEIRHHRPPCPFIRRGRSNGNGINRNHAPKSNP